MQPSEDPSSEPRVIKRADHPISRKSFDKEALWVLQRLRENGYRAYLVGGAVRDLYLGKSPKDYDVATDAKPSRIKRLFRNCRIIGRRFRIAHVFFPSGMIIEVATFRCNSERNLRGESGMILRDNEYGTPAEDAARRDLTINGLFYDLETFSIIDYVGGVEDLDRRVVRMINPPDQSFREDPVRMIRALRHASRTGFDIDSETLDSIYDNAEWITEANPSRLLEELFKDLRGGCSAVYFRSALRTGLLDRLLPSLADQLDELGDEHPLWSRLEVLDTWIRAGRTPSNPVLIAILLHTILIDDEKYWDSHGKNPPNIWGTLLKALRAVPNTIRISRRDNERVAQILISFRKIGQCADRGKLAPALANKNYIREAIEFFSLDGEARKEEVDFTETWIEEVDRYTAARRAQGGDRNDDESEDGRPRRKRRRRRRRRPLDDDGDGDRRADENSSSDGDRDE